MRLNKLLYAMPVDKSKSLASSDVCSTTAAHPSPQASSRIPAQSVRDILWIDDEVNADDASVRLMTLEGFRVRCADSGTVGLKLALTDAYDGIILDLRLPDEPGLVVLERLIAAGVRAHVLILTGFGDAENATVAMKLGAKDFKCKPLFAEDLLAAATALTVSAQTTQNGSIATGRGAHLDLESARAPTDEDLAGAAVALTRLQISALEFVGLTHRFRGALVPRRPGRSKPAFGNSPVRSLPIDGDATSDRLLLQSVSKCLEHGLLRSAAEVAHEIGIDPNRLGRILRDHTGAGYRECRRALRLRSGLREVAFTQEQIAQVAFTIGYDHAGQFDRDFRLSFGLTPRSFRALCRRGDAAV
jgi:DNA-binding response OmpR family regulator